MSIVTRLEILSRPKAPKILQELLWISEELPSPRHQAGQRFQKIPKDSKRFQKTQKDFERIQKIPKVYRRLQRDYKRFPWLKSSKLQAAGAQKANISSLRIKELEAPALLGRLKIILAFQKQKARGLIAWYKKVQN